MSELIFIRINNLKYRTVDVNIKNAVINIKEEDYKIIERTKTKYRQTKAKISLFNVDLIEKLKSWEEEINDYLKCKVGTEGITILYGNNIYPKVGQNKDEHQIKIKSIWINEYNKPFIQLYYIRNT